MPALKYRLRSVSQPLSVEDYRALAARRIPAIAWSYLERGAESEVTFAANRRAFSRWALRQRVLTGVESPRLAVSVAGLELSLPVLAAPTGISGLAHPSGEPAIARAAESRGTRAVVSTASSYSIEEVASAVEQPHLFQLYPGPAGTDLTERFIDRARDAGYAGLVVTVDTATTGNREAERRAGMGVVPVLTPRSVLDALARPRWCYGFAKEGRVVARNFVEATGARAGVQSVKQHSRVVRPDLVWTDVARMRERWDGPFIVKGILDPDDAEKAAEIGADAIVVSNHGGRQLDRAPATLDALPAIAARIAGRMPILLDGGIRRGADIVQALCLGASAVLIGRPCLYGLGANGQAGVQDVFDILRTELERTLLLMGVADVAELDRSCLLPAVGPPSPLSLAQGASSALLAADGSSSSLLPAAGAPSTPVGEG
ncbi:MAG: alpha-hydroxy acid oxidase [Solirubrobacteraceae bacterium]